MEGTALGRGGRRPHTAIDGLLVVDLPLHHDARGWFKENWQHAKMVPLGVPDFRPGPGEGPGEHEPQVGADVTRGFHAEPWDKFVRSPPADVDDQHGRLTFAAAITHLVGSQAGFGNYNATNNGPTQSWFDIATEIFALVGAEGTVLTTTIADDGRGKDLALDLLTLRLTGLSMPDASGRTPENV